MIKLRKINKGLILTIIVILALVIYLVGVEKQREADKQEIKNACEEFLKFRDKYTVLPEQEQTVTTLISEQVKEQAEKELKQELEKQMINNNEAIEIQYDYLLSTLQKWYENENIKSKFKRTIDKITEYEFDGNQVTLRFNSTEELTYKYIDQETGKEMENQEKNNYIGNEIILQKVDKQWKIVYSTLIESDSLQFVDTIMR